ncbi:MAG: amidase [Xanthobacteraceae bacterium]|nr:amidase [Xanthobacteraceae bacterium]MBX3533429.1 amidase [Xanthobacteraceae bacterium]MCW5676369.1 amidase [Xanthobacteraceae bacterium]
MVAPTLSSLAADLAIGRVTARSLVEDCLSKTNDPDGQGRKAFIEVDEKSALAAADLIDELRSIGVAPSELAGIPISIKDLFDIKGQVTRAGSLILRNNKPATADATAVARLRSAGMIIIGRTNMTEFAYSGIGHNPHFGTPKGIFRREVGFIPGGSSSGAAVSVADGMAHAALGSDTGGSCRIPAAYNGLVGFKPTQGRVPLDGIIPLSSSLDSVGPIGRSVDCCSRLDAIIANQKFKKISPRPVKGLRLLLPSNVVLDELDEAVSRSFERALNMLSEAGAIISHKPLSELSQIGPLLSNGGFTAAESYRWHRELLATKAAEYDPNILWRIRRGENITNAEYSLLIRTRRELAAKISTQLAEYDAMLAPTTAISAPRIAEILEPSAFTKANLLILRNCTLINFFDGCAISLPALRGDEAPLGIMLASTHGADSSLFEVAAGVESAFNSLSQR